MIRPPRPLLALLLVPFALTACGVGGSATASSDTSSSTAVSAGTSTPSAVIVILGSPTPSPVPTATPKPATTSAKATSATASVAASVTVSGTGKSGLKLRETPNGKEVAVLPEGTVLTPVGDAEQQSGGYTWLHVKTAKGEEGWVADKFISPPPGKSG